MEVVLRGVNDAFLEQVVFPALELGVRDAAPALERLIGQLADPELRLELELLLERGLDGSFFGLEDQTWSAAVYRLLFSGWARGPSGWSPTADLAAYAGDWQSTLHLTLMLEDERYPYADEARAAGYRHNVIHGPFIEEGLSALCCGLWHPPPAFPPDQVLTVRGHGDYRPHDGVARADWSWRGLPTVRLWAAQLPNQLSRLLEREARRLKPVQPPERHEVLQYWLGRIEEPPLLAVTFSGLGQGATGFIRELGQLARLIRGAAKADQGLTAVISQRGRDLA
jgi:hypothetical protein